MRKILLYALYTAIGIFALIGLFFTAVFIAMQFGLLNVRGSIADRNAFFTNFTSFTWPSSGLQAGVGSAGTSAPDISCISGEAVCNWNETREWAAVSGGLDKDSAIIARVSSETGVPALLIASVVVPEQIRFFTSEREVFKRYFEPLKILGSLSQFSLGVSGIKQETAVRIEQYANDPESLYFPGSSYASLIAYAPGTNHDSELYNRLTDDKNHYYSYLYTALFIKEIEAGWARSGFPIDSRADIIATLFNIGFDNSHPKADPQVAGALITVGGRNYTFGELAGLVYSSGQIPQE